MAIGFVVIVGSRCVDVDRGRRHVAGDFNRPAQVGRRGRDQQLLDLSHLQRAQRVLGSDDGQAVRVPGIEHPLHLYTQSIAAFAVRSGTMDEMTDRTLDSLAIPT